MKDTTDENLIRNVLFRLNMKLPVLYEVRENLDRQIRGIQAEINAWNARLNGNNGDALAIHKRRERPPKALIEAGAGVGVQSGWSKLTPEERSIEMKRRRAVAQEKRLARETEEARKHKSEAISAARKKRWASLTEAQRREWKAKMEAGRKRTGHYGGPRRKTA